MDYLYQDIFQEGITKIDPKGKTGVENFKGKNGKNVHIWYDGGKRYEGESPRWMAFWDEFFASVKIPLPIPGFSDLALTVPDVIRDKVVGFYENSSAVKIYPKHKNLLLCEEIIRKYKERTKSGGEDAYDKSLIMRYEGAAEALEKVSVILSEHFNANIQIITGAGKGMEFNACTIPTNVLVRAFTSNSKLYEVRNDRIAFSSQAPERAKYISVIVGYHLLHGGSEMRAEDVVAAILHEIGHNFANVNAAKTILSVVQLPIMLALNLGIWLYGWLDRLGVEASKRSKFAKFWFELIPTLLSFPTSGPQQLAQFITGTLSKGFQRLFQYFAEIVNNYGRIAGNLVALPVFFQGLLAAPAMMANFVATRIVIWTTMGGQSEERFADEWAVIHGYGEEIGHMFATGSLRAAATGNMRNDDWSESDKEAVGELRRIAERAYQTLNPMALVEVHPSSLQRVDYAVETLLEAKKNSKSAKEKARIQKQVDAILKADAKCYADSDAQLKRRKEMAKRFEKGEIKEFRVSSASPAQVVNDFFMQFVFTGNRTGDLVRRATS